MKIYHFADKRILAQNLHDARKAYFAAGMNRRDRK